MINDVTLKFWKDGREREEIQLKDLETGLSQSVFNNEDSKSSVSLLSSASRTENLHSS